MAKLAMFNVKCALSIVIIALALQIDCSNHGINNRREISSSDLLESSTTAKTTPNHVESSSRRTSSTRKASKTTTKPVGLDEEGFDDDVDFSVFDKSPAQRRSEKNTNAKLEESIIRAVKNFRIQNSDFDIASFLSGLLGKRRKRNAEIANTQSTEQIETISQLPFRLNDPSILSILTKTDVQKIAEDNVENNETEKTLKIDDANMKLVDDNEDDDIGEGDLNFDEFAEIDANNDEDVSEKKQDVTTPSNINKIPKKHPVLNRKPKSLHAKKIRKEFLNSNLTNDDVDSFLSDDSVSKNVTGVEKFLEVYSAQHLVENWGEIKKSLSAGCRHHMGIYLVGLVKRDLWALKMDDASGRYTTGYYWGNSYWSGSAVFCEHIAASVDEATLLVNKPQSRNGGLPQTTSHVNNHESGKPPFIPAFYTAKLHLQTKETSAGPHLIQLGMCLPSNCTLEDVHSMLNYSKISSPREMSVLSIRAPHLQYFNMFHDLTFQLLAAASVVVLGLMIAGTIYELALGPRLIQQNAHSSTPPAARHNSNNHHHHNNRLQANNERQLQGKSDEAAQQALPIVKMSNGKSIYSLNTNNNISEERLNIELNSAEETHTLNVFSELILSFSVIANMKTICDQSVGSDTIPTIHGLRSISMAWVILGHTCIIAFKYADNPGLRYDVEKEFLFQTVTNGAFSVDTFFCISGILVSYLYFRTNSKGSLERLTQGTKGMISGTIKFIGLLAYRFARLTTPYMFMLGVVEVTTKWFHHNSVFEPPTMDHENCPNYWWRNVLYINTLFPVEQMCMLWSWYLADDTQFYVVGAIILILAANHFKTAAGALSLFLVSSWFTTAYIAWSNNHMPSTDDPLALFDKIYDKPWTRLGPYLIGMAAGWYLFKTNCRVKMSKITVFCGWLFATAVMICLVYGLYNTMLTPVAAAAYSSLSHSAWALAVAWIVIACSTGYGGYINSLLSATILYPFSRVTYCAYLVHPVVIRFLAMHIDHPIHLGKAMMVVIFLGQMIASFALSFVISLAFEAPVVTMLKILVPNRRKKIH